MTAFPDTVCSRLSSPEAGLETEFGVSGLTTCEGKREEDCGEEGVNPRCRPTKDLATLAGNSRMSLPITVPCQAETARPLSITTPLPQLSDYPGKGVTSAGVAFCRWGSPWRSWRLAGWWLTTLPAAGQQILEKRPGQCISMTAMFC